MLTVVRQTTFMHALPGIHHPNNELSTSYSATHGTAIVKLEHLPYSGYVLYSQANVYQQKS